VDAARRVVWPFERIGQVVVIDRILRVAVSIAHVSGCNAKPARRQNPIRFEVVGLERNVVAVRPAAVRVGLQQELASGHGRRGIERWPHTERLAAMQDMQPRVVRKRRVGPVPIQNHNHFDVAGRTRQDVTHGRHQEPLVAAWDEHGDAALDHRALGQGDDDGDGDSHIALRGRAFAGVDRRLRDLLDAVLDGRDRHNMRTPCEWSAVDG
jgi:hypothetical protein